MARLQIERTMLVWFLIRDSSEKQDCGRVRFLKSTSLPLDPSVSRNTTVHTGSRQVDVARFS